MLSLVVSLVWLLAMLGAAAQLRDGDRSPAAALAAAAGFAAALALASRLSPQPNWIAILIGLAAGWRLISGPLQRMAPLIAGAGAGLAAALAHAGGVEAGVAAGLTAAALVAGFVLRGPRRSPGHRRELLLVLVALATPLAGLSADLAFGWHSAAMLNSHVVPIEAPAPPHWAIAVVGLAFCAGVVRGAWIRR